MEDADGPFGVDCTSAVKSLLGKGIFTLSEAALYARLSTKVLSRWLFGNRQGPAVLSPLVRSEEKLVGFLDFVQTLAIREILLQKKVPLANFRQAIRIAKKQFDLDYPFAREHATYLRGNELVIRPPGNGSIEASGKHAGQRMVRFVEKYVENLGFDKNGLADLYRIYRHRAIVIPMRPEIRFGEPLLPSGYSAGALWDAIRSEGGIENAGKAFGVPREEVETAYRYFVEYLGTTKT